MRVVHTSMMCSRLLHGPSPCALMLVLELYCYGLEASSEFADLSKPAAARKCCRLHALTLIALWSQNA